VSQNPRLAEFWSEAAAPLFPRSFDAFMWWIKALGRIAALPLGREVEELVALGAILGGAVLFRGRIEWLLRIVIPGLWSHPAFISIRSPTGSGSS